MRTRRHHAFTRTLIAACAAAICGLAVGFRRCSGPANRRGHAAKLVARAMDGVNTPTCWLLGGYGTNSYRWTQLDTNDAHGGHDAIELDISSLESGDRKLLTAFNRPARPAVSVRPHVPVDVWYKSDAQPVFFAFRPNLSGGGYGSGRSRRSSRRPPTGRTLVDDAGDPERDELPLGRIGSAGDRIAEMDDFSMVDATGSSGSDTAPSVPSGLVVSEQSSDGFRVTWSASSDDVGVTGYGVYLNGSQVGSTGAAELSYRFAGLPCGSSFTFGVDAVDGAGIVRVWRRCRFRRWRVGM